MTTHKLPPEEKNDGSALVWAGTGFVALVIVGVCVFVALGQQKKPAPATPAPPPQVVAEAPVQPRPAPAPAPQPVIEKPAPAPITPPPAVPEVPKETGIPKLQLDRLAGTLRLANPFESVGGKMPLEYTCYRDNMSPELAWHGAPTGTQSYVVFLEKRTPPSEDPFVNWVVFDIPAAATGLEQGQHAQPVLPAGGKHGNSDHNSIGYVGPCESHGKFTYALRVFALDTVLNLAAGATRHDLVRAMNGHIIDAAEQTFTHYYRL